MNKTNSSHNPEELYDYICSEIGFETKKQAELREAIKLFGQLREQEGKDKLLDEVETAIFKITKIYAKNSR